VAVVSRRLSPHLHILCVCGMSDWAVGIKEQGKKKKKAPKKSDEE
jgi:hypothetical protein